MSIDIINQTGPQSGTNWDVIISNHNETNTQSSLKITSYQSPATSLRGLLIPTDEPICSLHIVLSTESNGGSTAWHHPDDGLPHTLEHLVFLGSQTHPHKGILDKLANRCMASGTNAWTATDHTAYTLSTAGGEGMLNLLPIFADHVLFPTLTEEGFVTEIHCINGRGEDSGVVYCEMQGRENTEGSLIDRAVMDLLYPKYEEDGAMRSCGYSAETGGKLSNLRNLDIDKIRRYHGEYYRSDNTLLLVTGNVDGEEFFRKLDEVEALVLKRQTAGSGSATNGGSRTGRPWINSYVPPMQSNIVGVYPPHSTKTKSADPSKPLVITFPSEDESRGTISIAWRGPPYSHRSTWAHLSLLWDYLTESAASPLQLAFVENDDPICAYVGPARDVFTQGYHQVWFSECDVEKMEEVVPLFYDVMVKQCEESGSASSFDVGRMKTVIRRYRRRLLEASERRPTDVIVDGIIRNFMYGPRAGEECKDGKNAFSKQEEMEALKADIDILPFLDDAETRLDDASYWRSLIREFILGRPMAAVIGKPSAAMAAESSQKEKEREEAQAANLGEEGLKNLANTLEAAMAKNEAPIPEDILTSLPIPDLEKVPSIPLFTIRLAPSPSKDSLPLEIVPESVRGVEAEDTSAVFNQVKQSAESMNIHSAPFLADFTHIDSAFVFAAVGIDTTSLNPEQRLYLPILDEIIFKLPATLDNGERLTKDEFLHQIHDQTVSFSCGVGLLGGSIPQMAYISVQTDNTDGEGLATALTWIKRALYQTEITGEAVKTAVQKLISEIPPQVRSGPTVAATVVSELMFDSEKSNTVACNVLRQKPFLSKLFAKIGGKLDNNDAMEVDQESDAPTNDSGVQDIIDKLEQIRKILFQTTNYHAFVAANLRTSPNIVGEVVKSLSNSSSPASTIGRLIENVSAVSVRRAMKSGGEGAVCGLSAIESGFLNILSDGIKPYDPMRPALLVAIEYLTALEGDFWVKLRGAGLTYSYSISDSTDSQLLKFGLFKCTDITAAFEKASEIIAEYASGKAKVSAISLENAKASLAHQVISGRSSKLSAATSSFVKTFKGERANYDQYLLSGIASVTETDVIHALITYLVPCFDPSSNLVIACPPNKLDSIYDYFVSKGWSNLKKVPEEKLFDAFAGSDSDNVPALPDKVAGMSMLLPGAFAAQFRCSCPRCER